MMTQLSQVSALGQLYSIQTGNGKFGIKRVIMIKLSQPEAQL